MEKIRDRLRKKVLSEYNKNSKKDKRIVKTVTIAGVVMAVLFLSRYFVKAVTETVKACKNLRNAIRR
ncbi:MAG: hypothetical protein MI921_17545 [Cytophagales bacterium]|nr:hypothetical protein [Cytophagales bacterium]